jgi:hypothetical protein
MWSLDKIFNIESDGISASNVLTLTLMLSVWMTVVKTGIGLVTGSYTCFADAAYSLYAVIASVSGHYIDWSEQQTNLEKGWRQKRRRQTLLVIMLCMIATLVVWEIGRLVLSGGSWKMELDFPWYAPVFAVALNLVVQKIWFHLMQKGPLGSSLDLSATVAMRLNIFGAMAGIAVCSYQFHVTWIDKLLCLILLLLLVTSVHDMIYQCLCRLNTERLPG